jgi:hypothetical protein
MQKAAETKYKNLCRGTVNVEHAMYIHTCNKWSHHNSKKRFKENFGSYTREMFIRFTAQDSYMWNVTHNMESTAFCILKPG